MDNGWLLVPRAWHCLSVMKTILSGSIFFQDLSGISFVRAHQARQSRLEPCLSSYLVEKVFQRMHHELCR